MRDRKRLAIILLGTALAGMLAFEISTRWPGASAGPSPENFASIASAESEGAKLGRAYGPTVVAGLADAWVAAADAVAAGKTIAEAQTILQDRWSASRQGAFTKIVAPTFAKVIAEGSEPTDDAHRAVVAATLRGFARGLRGGK